MHNQNLQTTRTEMFKKTKGFALDIFSNAFITRNKLNYNMYHASHFDVPLVNPVYNGTESTSFLEYKIWDTLPNKIKELKTVQTFKGVIKIETRKLPGWTL